jgi:hypothetical protein
MTRPREDGSISQGLVHIDRSSISEIPILLISVLMVKVGLTMGNFDHAVLRIPTLGNYLGPAAKAVLFQSRDPTVCFLSLAQLRLN